MAKEDPVGFRANAQRKKPKKEMMDWKKWQKKSSKGVHSSLDRTFGKSPNVDKTLWKKWKLSKSS